MPVKSSAHAALELDPRVYSRALDCVHCGLCLPACPTYTQNGLEGDSPRGRIYLMKGLADGKIGPTASVLEHLDLCLDCRACETACPSGVQYHELIEATRAKFTEHPPAAMKRKTVVDRLVDAMFFRVFPFPFRLKLALLPARLMQKVGLWKVVTMVAGWLPARVQKMVQMLPPKGPVWERNLPAFFPANKANCPDGKPRVTVGFLAGCIGSVLYQHVNRQAIALLQHAGCDVVAPPAQSCCGAIHHHAGHEHEGADFARRNVDAFVPRGASEASEPAGPPAGSGGGADTPRLAADVIVSTIAGCGAQLKDYGMFLRDDPVYADRAKLFASKVRDISEVLVQFAPPPPPASTRNAPITVTYHDACHLAHAQRVTAPPRQLLGRVPGLKLVPLAESDMCCGAAGTYNLSQPEMAMQLGERKVTHIKNTGAPICVTGNVGCAMQIQSEAKRLGVEVKVMHPVSVLYEAYFGADVK